MAKSSPFGPQAVEFLADLQSNNKRAWFEKNKARYENDVREPALEFVRQMAPELEQISAHFVASDKKAGGSLMRIHRDTRFSKDKSPYKMNVGLQFRHEQGKDIHAPGFYVHLEIGQCFLGAGMWHPEPEALAAVREAITGHPQAWKKIRDARPFRRHFDFEGESLKRAPKGFDPDHPMIDDLRRKDHIAVHRFDQSAMFEPGFVRAITQRFKAATAYMQFQCEAVGVAF